MENTSATTLGNWALHDERSFLDSDSDGLIAHELAHQWWGVGVQPATYHDRWLSEGFAEFAGLWYMGHNRGSAELYMDRLEETMA